MVVVLITRADIIPVVGVVVLTVLGCTLAIVVRVDTGELVLYQLSRELLRITVVVVAAVFIQPEG